MKRLLSVLLGVLLVFAVGGCADPKGSGPVPPDPPDEVPLKLTLIEDPIDQDEDTDDEGVVELAVDDEDQDEEEDDE